MEKCIKWAIIWSLPNSTEKIKTEYIMEVYNKESKDETEAQQNYVSPYCGNAIVGHSLSNYENV